MNSQWTIHNGDRDRKVEEAQELLIKAIVNDDQQALLESRRIDRELGKQPSLNVVSSAPDDTV